MIFANGQVGQLIEVLILVLYFPQAHPVLTLLPRKLDLLLHLRMQRYLRSVFFADLDELAHCLYFWEGKQSRALDCFVSADELGENGRERIGEIELATIVPRQLYS